MPADTELSESHDDSLDVFQKGMDGIILWVVRVEWKVINVLKDDAKLVIFFGSNLVPPIVQGIVQGGAMQSALSEPINSCNCVYSSISV